MIFLFVLLFTLFSLVDSDVCPHFLTYGSYSDAVACLRSVPFSDDIREQTLLVLDFYLPSYVFLHQSLDSGPPYNIQYDVSSAISSLAVAPSASFLSDFDFHEALKLAISPLFDSHTRYSIPLCYSSFSFKLPFRIQTSLGPDSKLHFYVHSVQDSDILLGYCATYPDMCDWTNGAYVGNEILSIDSIPILQYLENLADKSSYSRDKAARFNYVLRESFHIRKLFFEPMVDSHMIMVDMIGTGNENENADVHAAANWLGSTSVPYYAREDFLLQCGYHNYPPDSSQSPNAAVRRWSQNREGGRGHGHSGSDNGGVVVFSSFSSPSEYFVGDVLSEAAVSAKAHLRSSQARMNRNIFHWHEHVQTSSSLRSSSFSPDAEADADTVADLNDWVLLSGGKQGSDPIALYVSKNSPSDGLLIVSSFLAKAAETKIGIASKKAFWKEEYQNFVVGVANPIAGSDVDFQDIDTTAYRATVRTYVDAMMTAKSHGMKNLIVDVRGNDGGILCLGYMLARLLAPEAPLVPEPNSDLPQSELNERYYCPSNFVGRSELLTQSRTRSSGVFRSEVSRIEKRGGVETKLSQLVHLSCRPLNEEIGYGEETFQNVLRKELSMFPPERLLILTDGTCGSTCGVFVKLMQQLKLAKIISQGGIYGESWPAVASFKGSAVMTNLQLRSDHRDWLACMFCHCMKDIPSFPSSTAFLTLAWLENYQWMPQVGVFELDKANVSDPIAFTKQVADFHMWNWGFEPADDVYNAMLDYASENKCDPKWEVSEHVGGSCEKPFKHAAVGHPCLPSGEGWDMTVCQVYGCDGTYYLDEKSTSCKPMPVGFCGSVWFVFLPFFALTGGLVGLIAVCLSLCLITCCVLICCLRRRRRRRKREKLKAREAARQKEESEENADERTVLLETTALDSQASINVQEEDSTKMAELQEKRRRSLRRRRSRKKEIQ